ncbi:MAG TPA: hypothetical protein VGM56_31885 [Byssovorax sp.]|jgi:hypothetical protein
MDSARVAALVAAAALAAACGGNVYVDADGSGGAGRASTAQTTGGSTSTFGPEGASTGPGTSVVVGVGPSSSVGVGPSSSGVGPSSSAAVVGVGPSTGSGSTCTNQAPFGDPRCDACAAASCCSESLQCASSITTACSVYERCVAGGQSQTTCAASFAHGFQQANDLATCLVASCLEQCPMEIAAGEVPVCDSGVTTLDPACAACLGDQQNGCCQAFEACITDSTCERCIAQQQTAGCDANPSFAAASACLYGTCAAPCMTENGAGGGASASASAGVGGGAPHMH